MARLLALNPKEMAFKTVECNCLDDYYTELDCDVFDIARRTVAGKPFDIFCDDMGLFRDDPMVSAVDKNGAPMLVGNLIFANHDGQGNTIDITDEDIALICENVYPYIRSDGMRGLAVRCEY